MTIVVMLAVTIWYFGWAKRTFTGPIRTIDLEVGAGAGAAARAPGVAPASPPAV